MRIILPILLPPIIIFILALAMILAPLPHPFPEAKSPERNRVSAVITGILGAAYLVGLAFYVVSWFMQAGQALDPALVPLGLTSEGYMGFGRQYHGEIKGRQVEVTYQPAQTLKPSLLNVYVGASAGTQAALGPEKPLLDCRDCLSVDVEELESEQLHVVAHDEAWVRRLLANPANAAAVSRLLDDQKALGLRELYIQPNRIWLRAHPEQITENYIQRWLDDLLILAEAVEANTS
ncbi:MAG: hypothetical protein JW918_10790 [Anaerolineae bacterium]|nr:hypothetical protein [Anaerolineae bacterium]